MALTERCFVENPGLESKHVLSRLAAGTQIVLDKSELRDHHAELDNRRQAGRLEF